jgi:N,N'-diacetyllegionaminate synthase
MSSLGEVEAAVRAVRGAGNSTFALLHCVSNYPADPAEANLRAMHTLAAAFGAPVGFSDHTPGNEVALAAVALGACVLEKHFTLDRSLPGPDHQASLEPSELRGLVRGIRKVEAALGHGSKEATAGERETAAVARKSLVAACDIAAGTILADEHIAVLRPGTGLPPALRPYLVGRTTRVAVPAGTVFEWGMLQ